MDLSPIAPFLPTPSVLPLIEEWVRAYTFELKITRPRSTKLGDFRPPRPGQVAKLTLNGNLGPYQFLTTLTHEIAHLIAWERYGRKAMPHGKEWKMIFSTMLRELEEYCEWPIAYSTALKKHAKSPKSAVGGDPLLQQTILQLDGMGDQLLLQELVPGDAFTFKNRAFTFKEKRRTRALVVELSTKRQFTIPLVARIERID